MMTVVIDHQNLALRGTHLAQTLEAPVNAFEIPKRIYDSPVTDL